MSNLTKDRFKECLLESFENPIKAMKFINEKRKILYGKLYKYCPISDDKEAIQYSIENLKDSIIYMSKITDFNDPFDTYISFSIDNIIRGLVPQILKNSADINLDENTEEAIPIAFDLLSNEKSPVQDSNVMVKYIVKCIKNNPDFLAGEVNTEAFGQELFKSISEDIINGTISPNELNSISNNANDPRLLLNIIRECVNDTELVDKLGDKDSLIQVQEVFSGKSPEIESAREEYRKVVDAIKPELSDAIKKVRMIINEKYYVTCFSTDVNNALMWAHYTNKHKGFCVEYDLYKTDNKAFLINLHPVIYSERRASVPTSLFDLSDISNIKVSTTDESIVDLFCAMLTKSNVWNYENEWRLLLYDEIEELTENKFKIDCISKIILGCRIEEKYEQEIKEICNKNGIHLSKMKLDENSYQLHEEIIF